MASCLLFIHRQCSSCTRIIVIGCTLLLIIVYVLLLYYTTSSNYRIRDDIPVLLTFASHNSPHNNNDDDDDVQYNSYGLIRPNHGRKAANNVHSDTSDTDTNNNGSNQYSSFVCVGDGHHKITSGRLVACHFKNICYNPFHDIDESLTLKMKSQWTYFSRANSEAAVSETLMEWNSVFLTEFWDQFVKIQANPPLFWKPFIKHKAAPIANLAYIRRLLKMELILLQKSREQQQTNHNNHINSTNNEQQKYKHKRLILNSEAAQTVTEWISEPIVFEHPYVTDNFGHCLGDNFYPIWHLLSIFNMYSKNARILFRLLNILKDKSSIKHITAINAYLFNQMPLILAHNGLIIDDIHQLVYFDKDIWHSRLELNPRTTPSDIAMSIRYLLNIIPHRVCFRDILVGVPSLKMQRSNTPPFEWKKFIFERFLASVKHKRVYNHFMQLQTHLRTDAQSYSLSLNTGRRAIGLKTIGMGTHIIRKQNILFLNKTVGIHRRYYANPDLLSTVMQYISDLFLVQIDFINDVDLFKMTLEQQIDFVLKYNLLISPCGSLSFLSVFMREGTAKIVVDWWHEHYQKSTQLESYIWEFDTMHKTYYYYVTADDYVVKISPEVIRKHHIIKHDISLHWSDYILRKKRLARYVYNALIWIENYNGWTHTFKYPSATANWSDIMEVQTQERTEYA